RRRDQAVRARAPVRVRLSARDRVRRRPAEDADRQDPAHRAARGGAREEEGGGGDLAMPLVHAHVGPRFDRADALKRACWQIVPAAYDTEQGPQNPGSIFFLHYAATHADDMMGPDGMDID